MESQFKQGDIVFFIKRKLGVRVGRVITVSNLKDINIHEELWKNDGSSTISEVKQGDKYLYLINECTLYNILKNHGENEVKGELYESLPLIARYSESNCFSSFYIAEAQFQKSKQVENTCTLNGVKASTCEIAADIDSFLSYKEPGNIKWLKRLKTWLLKRITILRQSLIGRNNNLKHGKHM